MGDFDKTPCKPAKAEDIDGFAASPAQGGSDAEEAQFDAVAETLSSKPAIQVELDVAAALLGSRVVNINLRAVASG